MELNEVVMRQAVEGLELADGVLQDLEQRFKKTEVDQSRLAEFTALTAASHAYAEKISFAIPIARLNATHYSTHHRNISRVALLLQACLQTHRRLNEVMNQYRLRPMRDVERSERLLDLTRRGLAALLMPGRDKDIRHRGGPKPEC